MSSSWIKDEAKLHALLDNEDVLNQQLLEKLSTDFDMDKQMLIQLSNHHASGAKTPQNAPKNLLQGLNQYRLRQ